jgi:Tol biopolymer transport system component
MKFSPMIYNGTTYEQLPAKIVDSPFEGDSVLSPSGQLVVSRLAGQEGKTLGYVIRRVEAEKFGANYQINIDKVVARVCISGAKANISYDERFMVTHHYENDTSNIYLVDLLTGSTTRVTNMPAKVKALFPHFRSDGWFYFLVKDKSGETTKEYMLGSDLAVVLTAADTP